MHQQFSHLESSAKITDTAMSRPVVSHHISSKMAESSKNATREKYVPIVVPRLPTGSSSSTTSTSTTSLPQDVEDSTFRPATTRSQSTSSQVMGDQLRESKELCWSAFKAGLGDRRGERSRISGAGSQSLYRGEMRVARLPEKHGRCVRYAAHQSPSSSR